MPFLPYSTVPRGIGACITPKPKAISNVYPRGGLVTGTGTGTGTGPTPPPNPPIVNILTFVLSPGITVTWNNTGGAVTSPYSVVLRGNSFSPPTTILDSTTTASTSYTSGVTTTYDFYYYYTITGTNADGSSSASTSILQAPSLPPSIAFSSFSFGGVQGSTSAAPTWNWTNSGGVPVTNQYFLYSDTFSPPTTLVASGSLGATAVTFAYGGATVDGNYYALNINATNTGGSSSFTNIQQNNRVPPVLTFSSFSFGGVQGSTTAAPTWNWTRTGGILATQTYVLYSDASNPPSTVIASGSLGASDLTFTYGGATVDGNYYTMEVTGTNTGGSSSFNNTQVNNRVAPDITFSSFAFAGTIGGVSATPTWNWTLSGGAVATMSFTLYADATPSPTSVVASGTLSTTATSYAYTGATVADYYYRLAVSVVNTGGADSFDDTDRQNLRPPAITFASFSWTGGQGLTTAAPEWTWTSTGGAPASYQVRLLERVFGVPPYVLIDTQTPSGTALSYLYSGAVQQDYEYEARVTAFNPSGSSNFNNAQQNLLLSPNPVETAFAWDGVDGSGYYTQPHWYWTNTGGKNLIGQSYVIYGDASNPPTTVVDVGSLSTTDTDFQWNVATTPNDYYQFVLTQTNTASIAGGGPNGIMNSTIQQSTPA